MPEGAAGAKAMGGDEAVFGEGCRGLTPEFITVEAVAGVHRFPLRHRLIQPALMEEIGHPGFVVAGIAADKGQDKV